MTFGSAVWISTVAAVAFVVVGLGVLDTFALKDFALGENRCKMTYMRPSYTKVPLSQQAAVSAKPEPGIEYSLYSYTELDPSPRTAGKTRKSIVQPVLFVPGNAGSYKQVRSMASEAARKETRSNISLVFYSADLEGEFSAFRTLTLEAQTRFIRDVIAQINAKHGPKSPGVILVCHSMGGVLAKVASESLEQGSVLAIVTLNTPHANPVVAHAPGVVAFYESASVRSKNGIPLVSIAGGFRDTIVNSRLCDVGNDARNVTAFTASIPGVFVEADHQCIAWCNQLVVTLDRILRTIATKPRSELLAALGPILSSKLGSFLVDGAPLQVSPAVSEDSGSRQTVEVRAPFPAVFRPAKAGTYSLATRDMSSALFIRVATDRARVLLCLKSECKDASMSFEVLPPSQSGSTESLLYLSRSTLQAFDEIRIVASRDVAWIAVQELANSETLPMPNQFDKFVKLHGAGVHGVAGSAVHVNAPVWRKYRPLRLTVECPSEGEFVVLAFFNSGTSKQQREMRAQAVRTGESLRLDSHFPPRSLDIFVLGPVLQSHSDLFRIAFTFDILGLLGHLFRDLWPHSIGAALAASFLARMGPPEQPIVSTVIRQAPAALIGICSVVWLAPFTVDLDFGFVFEEIAFLSASSVVICVLAEVLSFPMSAFAKISTLIVFPSALREKAKMFVAFSIAGASIAFLPSFFTLVASVFFLSRNAFISGKHSVHSKHLARLFILPMALAAVEVFGSPKLCVHSFIRDGHIDGYEIPAAIAACQAIVGPFTALGHHIPTRARNLIIAITVALMLWFGLFRCYVSSAILAVGSAFI